MANLHWFDWIVAFPLLLGLYKGFTKGFLIEVASTFAFVLALFGGVRLTDVVAIYLTSQFQVESKFLPLITFFLVFVVILISVFAIAKLLEAFVKVTMLSWLNKLSGAVFGLMKAGLMVSFVIYFTHYFNLKLKFYQEDKLFKESISYGPSLDLTSKVVTYFGKQDNLLEKFNKLIKNEFDEELETISSVIQENIN